MLIFYKVSQFQGSLTEVIFCTRIPWRLHHPHPERVAVSSVSVRPDWWLQTDLFDASSQSQSQRTRVVFSNGGVTSSSRSPGGVLDSTVGRHVSARARSAPNFPAARSFLSLTACSHMIQKFQTMCLWVIVLSNPAVSLLQWYCYQQQATLLSC